MDALSKVAAPRAAACSATTTPQRVFTTVGPEQEYFLIDEQYFYERPDLYTTGRTLFGAKPPKGHELDDHYFGSIPERVLACMLESERELRAPRRAGQDPPQRGRPGAVRARADLRELERRLRPSAAHDAGDAERRPPLRPRLPAAREAVRRRQRLGQAQQLVDGHGHRAQPARAGRHAEREPAVPVLLRGRDGGRRQSPGAAARVGRQRRPGPPPWGQRGAAGDHLDLPRRRAGEGLRGRRIRQGRRRRQRHFLGLGTPVLPPLPLHGGDRNRTSPFAFTGNKFEFRALGSSMSLGFANTVLNTIVAEAIDEMADEVEAALQGARSATTPFSRSSGRPGRRTSAIVFGGDNYSDEWHEEAEKRGLANLRTTPDALPWMVEKQTIARLRALRGALRARAGVALRGVRRAVRDEAQHRGGDGRVDRAHDDPAGRRRATSRELQGAPAIDGPGDGGRGR